MDAIETGQAAGRLLEDRGFLAAVKATETRIVSEWRGAETVGGRETAHAKMLVLEEIVGSLVSVMNQGTVEEYNRDHEPES